MLAQTLPSLPNSSPGATMGIRQDGLFLTAPVVIDGTRVFRVAALAAPSRSELPIDVRILFVGNAITQILAQTDLGTTAYDPKTFKVIVARVGSQEALEAKDDKHTNAVPIVTVTSADSQYARMPSEALAEDWQPLLQSALVAALQKRQPAEIKRNFNALTRIGIALVLATLLAAAGGQFLNKRVTRLKRQIDERHEKADKEQAQPETSDPRNAPRRRRRALMLALRAAGPDQQLQRIQAFTGFIGWVLVLAWAIAITWALLLFPQTTSYGQLVIRSVSKIVFIWIGAAIVNKLLDLAIVRVADAYAHRGIESEDRARHLLRAPTISRSLGGFKGFIIIFVAALTTLSVLNIPIASVVTIGGVLALAIGFAAQSLVRDFLNGLLVLFEDQYVVGDYIMIGDYNGIVENLTLRVVQIRDVRGHLITIPHNTVTQVVNASRNWSRVDFRIPIDVGADVPKAVATLRATLVAVAKDPAWRSAILAPVEWIGLESPSKNGIVLRAAIRTAPLRQFEVQRELNARVCAAFEHEGIPLGVDPIAVPGASASPSPL
ncbi:MAG TPA: mechanosensitive ion channel family protein [Candidatus Baltobacteraceae bacterium]|nr:mechanosensitive ion channel family protein [Candidatus Baltobacteraceae bacterium]